MIAESSAYIDLERFDEVRDAESDITQQFRDHLEGLELDNEEDS